MRSFVFPRMGVNPIQSCCLGVSRDIAGGGVCADRLSPHTAHTPEIAQTRPTHSAVKLPKIGWVKFRQSREIPDGATLKQVRIVRRASGWLSRISEVKCSF